VTAAVVNPDLATNKCLELVAETTAPALSLEQLLEGMATEITKVNGGSSSVMDEMLSKIAIRWSSSSSRSSNSSNSSSKGWVLCRSSNTENPELRAAAAAAATTVVRVG
jgi:hypothetical protein